MYETLLGFDLESIWAAKIDPKSIWKLSGKALASEPRFWSPALRWEERGSFWKRFQHATDIEERFDIVLGRLGHQCFGVF